MCQTCVDVSEKKKKKKCEFQFYYPLPPKKDTHTKNETYFKLNSKAKHILFNLKLSRRTHRKILWILLNKNIEDTVSSISEVYPSRAYWLTFIYTHLKT